MGEQQRLLVLGAGRHQAPLIRRVEERGISAVAVDYYEDPPGKRFATYAVRADALDRERVLTIAREYAVDGITTVGTDQAVLVMANVAHDLDLPCHVSPEGGLRATNKSAMRPALVAAGVPMPEAVTLERDATDTASGRLPNYPCVVKAADSQGQRGMRIARSAAELMSAIDAARAQSRTSTVIVEHFHEGPEVTINAWVIDGRAAFVAVLDRITLNPPPSIGICVQHVYPSTAVPDVDDVAPVVESVARAYDMQRGPLYIQAIASNDGIRVIEAAARVGGGHEAQLFPRLFDINLLDRTIDLALGNDERPLPSPSGAASGLVNFIVAEPGIVDRLRPIDEVVDRGLVDEGAWYIQPGYEQPVITDSMGRVGYVIVTAPAREIALERAAKAYAQLEATDGRGRNLVFWPDESVINQPG